MNSIGFPNTDIYSEHEQGGDESFWPSFTDIMMVIVMTFLLITVAVILNNYELINNLKASVAAERQAMAQTQTALQVVQIKAQENETLEERLARLENLLSVRTQNLQQTRQQQQQTFLALNASQQETQAAQVAIQNLEQTNRNNAENLTNLQQSLQKMSVQTTLLQKQKSESATAEQQARASLISVQDKLENTGKELAALRQKDIEGHERLVSMQGEFDQLDKKYQKLLRPARSVKNKHVVRVIFNKNSGVSSYQIGEQDKDNLRTLSKGNLHKALTQLKLKHGDDLYVKIIIPASSKVSHAEAWKFTSEMLNKYDYYHSNKN
ncbi:MAG: hypothetical protein V3U84_10650 [Thiotrichaceae bacterium]